MQDGETPTSETLPAEGRGRRGLWSCRRSEDRRRYRLLTGLLNPGHEAHQRQLGGDLHGGGRGREGASYHHTVMHRRAGPEVCGARQGNRKSVKKKKNKEVLQVKAEKSQQEHKRHFYLKTIKWKDSGKKTKKELPYIAAYYL